MRRRGRRASAAIAQPTIKGDNTMTTTTDTADLQASHAALFDALQDLVERDRAEAEACGFTDDEMSWLEEARRAIAKAKSLIA